jgi:hypothetical protein
MTNITKKEIRKGNIGNKKGWCFSIYWNNYSYPNFISALFKTKKEATSELKRYLENGNFVFYGSAE